VLAHRKLMHVDVILHCTLYSALSTQHSLSWQHSALSTHSAGSTQHSAPTQLAAPRARALSSPKHEARRPKIGWDVGTVVSLFLLWYEVMMTKKFQNSKTRPNRIDTAMYVLTYLLPMMAYSLRKELPNAEPHPSDLRT
jgi:hypothetical protein